MNDRITFAITEEEANERLDKLLTLKYTEYSRSYFQYLFTSGAVRLNGKPVKKREKAPAGSTLEIEFIRTPEITATPQNIPLDILYEDEDLIAINKSPGMVTHPAPGSPKDTFVNALLFHLKSHDFTDSLRPGIVHRLDKDTSGVMIAAKHSKSHAKLVEAFQQKEIKKSYLALCLNNPSSLRIDAPIGRHPMQRKKMIIREDGKAAQTELSILSYENPMSLLQARPITGRTHQIRVHLRSVDCPILGDNLYGNPSLNEKFGIKRQMLHAHEISLNHPLSGKPLHLVAPLPEDLLACIKKFNLQNKNR